MPSADFFIPLKVVPDKILITLSTNCFTILRRRYHEERKDCDYPIAFKQKSNYLKLSRPDGV